MTLRHLFLFASAPGRYEEAEHALRTWLAAIDTAPQVRGGALLRGRPGEFGDLPPLLALTFDLASAQDGPAFKEAIKTVPNPMADDIPGSNPPDQGHVLFDGCHDPHQHGDHDHPGHAGEHAHERSANLEFDRGGGLLARLFHGHFEVIEDVQPAPAAHGSGR